MIDDPAVGMPLLDGGLSELLVPTPRHGTEWAAQTFEESSRAISAEWALRQGRNDRQRREWLQKVCYAYLSWTLESGSEGLFAPRISRFRRGRRGVSRPFNPFRVGLLAIFAHDQRNGPNEKLREYAGNRLWYAYRHFIPPTFLIGFLHEVWRADTKQRAESTFIEPAFKDWYLHNLIENWERDRRADIAPEYVDLLERCATMAGIADQAGDPQLRPHPIVLI